MPVLFVEPVFPRSQDEWGEGWDHDWPVWRKMLPQFLDEILPD